MLLKNIDTVHQLSYLMLTREPGHTAPPILPNVAKEPGLTAHRLSYPMLIECQDTVHQLSYLMLLKNQDTLHHLSYLMLLKNQDTLHRLSYFNVDREPRHTAPPTLTKAAKEHRTQCTNCLT